MLHILNNKRKIHLILTQELKTLFIMIHSYKGGTGKTSIAVNLAHYYAEKDHKKVLLIEQDAGGPSLNDIFYVDPKYYWNDFYNNNLQLQDLILSTKYFDIICANSDEIKIPDGIESQTYFVRQIERFNYEKRFLNQKYDIVIFDTHPGYNLSLINCIAVSDIVLLVSRPDSDVILNTIDLYNKIYSHFQSKKIIIIENQVPEPIGSYKIENIDRKYISSIERWRDFLKDKKAIQIPLTNEIAYPLSLSKIIPFENLLFSYIKKIFTTINDFRVK